MPGIHHDWGLAPYDRLHLLQERLVALRAEDRIPNLLLTGEHLPVVTLGRKTPPERAYPAGSRSSRWSGAARPRTTAPARSWPTRSSTSPRPAGTSTRFQRDLEEVGIRTLADFGHPGRAAGGDDRRLGRPAGRSMSLGIAVRRWVTWHGLALNVRPTSPPSGPSAPAASRGRS